MLNPSLLPQDNAASIFFHGIHWGIHGVLLPGSDYFILTKDQYLQVKSMIYYQLVRMEDWRKKLTWRLIALMHLAVK